MYLLAMDFPWNVPFSVFPVLIGSDYGVFIFLLGVGTQPVGTLPFMRRVFRFFSSCDSHNLTHENTLSKRLDKIRFDRICSLKKPLRCF